MNLQRLLMQRLPVWPGDFGLFRCAHQLCEPHHWCRPGRFEPELEIGVRRQRPDSEFCRQMAGNNSREWQGRGVRLGL